MPKMPRIVSQVSARSAGVSGVRVSPEDTGVGIGQAIEGLGDQVRREEIKIEKREGESLAMSEMARFQRDEAELFQQSIVQNQENPAGFTDRYLKDYDKGLEDLLAKSDNKYYKEFVNNRFNALKVNATNRSINWEATQKNIVQKNRLVSSYEMQANMLQQNPEEYEAARLAILADTATAQQTATIDNAKGLAANAIKSAARSSVEGYLSQNKFQDAKDFLQNNADDFGDIYAQTEQRVNAKHKAFKTTNKSLVMMQDILSGRVLPNPSNTEHRDAFDEAYRSKREDFIKGDPEATLDVLNWISSTNLVGNDTKSDLQAMVYAPTGQEGGAEMVMAGLRNMSTINQTNPQAFDSVFTSRDAKLVALYESKMQVGHSNDEIMKQMVDHINADEVDQKVLTMRDKAVTKELRENKTMIADDLDDIIRSDTPAYMRDGLSVRYEQLMRNHYADHGDLGGARRYASMKINQSYKKSSANFGGGVMQFAPESIVTNEFQHKYGEIDWSKMWLGKKLKKFNLSEESFDDYYIRANDTTMKGFQKYREVQQQGGMGDERQIPYEVWGVKDGMHQAITNEDGDVFTITFNFEAIRDMLEDEETKKQISKRTTGKKSRFGNRRFGGKKFGGQKFGLNGKPFDFSTGGKLPEDQE